MDAVGRQPSLEIGGMSLGITKVSDDHMGDRDGGGVQSLPLILPLTLSSNLLEGRYVYP